MENVRNHRDIRLVATDKKRNKLVSESNHHRTKCFSERLIAIEMKKTKVRMGKPIYLGLSMLDLSKNVMYEFWYNFFFYLHIYIFRQKNTITRYVNINVHGIQVKRLEQRVLIYEIMFISLGNLGKPFLTWKTYIYKQK